MFNKSNIILHIDNLTISNIEKKNTLLHSVSFKIYESEFISMVGESGSGKSIICLTILSLLRSSNLKIDSGQIWYYKNNEKIPLLNLNEKEMLLYDTVANLLEKNIIRPDLVIYLQADTDTLMNNIARRGREMEEDISKDYIDALGQVYTEYFFRYQDSPLVIINTSNIDFVNNENDLKEIINFIRKPVSGTKFFNPVTDLK